MKIGIIGSGAWGTALAISLSRAGHDITLWSHSGLVHEFEGVQMPAGIRIVREFAPLADADVWLIATPSEFLEETIARARESYHDQPIIICVKGITKDGQMVNNVVRDALNLSSARHIGIFSGPQFAGEVAAGKLTGSTLASDDDVRSIARDIFTDFVLEETDDVIGVMFAGAGKNAAAVLMGYLAQNGAGENERALRLVQLWDEIISIGKYLGARDETFRGLAGLGDLILTATSPTSRNYTAGMELAAGIPINHTAEGIVAIRALAQIAEDAKIPVPNLVYFTGLIAK